ncbi:hypothetical protein FDP41_010029 [Naegleria fowleri]|uniref:Uncharacterized protein n=1 Tax=Naegleria fowleri TaxID=5763 RepID=A0A6A5BAP7_NAEFO|nr:uncharacterized protein FDP41_010029 [Naegleria fowleri]KAF0971806.1 hypothetical protein FDP41_010029 [Naegleria fowleri]CAG4713705.1 unnamed protein product [Naegleria fowleri]
MTTSQIRKNSKLNIAQPDLNLNELLKSIDSAIEENINTSLVLKSTKKNKLDVSSPVRSGSRSKITNLSPNHRLTSSAVLSTTSPVTTTTTTTYSSPHKLSSRTIPSVTTHLKAPSTTTATLKTSPSHHHQQSIVPSETHFVVQHSSSSQQPSLPLKSSFSKKANRNLYDEFSSATSSSEGEEHSYSSSSSFKKKVSVISPKTTSSLSRLPLSTLSNSKLNSSRLSVKDLKDSSTSSSDSDVKPSKKQDISKLFENGHKALNILQSVHENMKLTIPKDLRKDIRDKSQNFKSDCTRVLSQIDGLLNKVKALNHAASSPTSLTNSPNKFHVEERIDEEVSSTTSGGLEQDEFCNY